MAAKSVIDVQVNDEAFKKFYALYQGYQDQLKKMPGQWAQVASLNTASAKSFQSIVAALAAQTQLTVQAVAAQRQGAAAAGSSATAWQKIAGFTRQSAASVHSITLSLLRWSTLTTGLSGLLGLGSLWGLDRMAESVASTRRAAGGTGVSYGQQQSFGLNLGRFIDPQAMLQSVSSALYDVTSRGYVGLVQAGLAGRGGNAADTSAELLRRLPSMFAGTPRELTAARYQQLGLGNLGLSLQDVIRFLGSSSEERSTQVGRFKKDAQRFAVDDETQRKWQDFVTQLSRAGTGIERVFVTGLVRLEKPLERLSEAAEHVIANFLKSDKLQVLLGKVAEGIEHFGSYLLSEKFQSDMGTLVENVSYWAGKFSSVASGAVKTGSFLSKTFNPSTDLLEMVGKLERSADNAVSPKGAIGRYQIMPGTAIQYGFDPAKLKDPAYNETVARAILSDLVRRYHGNTDEVLVGYNAGPGVANRFRDSGHDLSVLGRESRGYLRNAHGIPGYQSNVKIDIYDHTGGKVSVTGQQVGAQSQQ